MERILRGVLLVLLVGSLAAPLWAQGVYTAASCKQSDVNAVINGPTHKAVDGDTINIPAGSCTWTTGITISSNIGIIVTGTGTPNSNGTTFGPSASCSSTNITLSGATAFTAHPAFGNSTQRISCMTISYGGGASVAFSVLGTCTSSGCPDLRVDNITFSNWAGHALAGISYGISAVGDMFGVIDHNKIDGSANVYLQLVEFSHASYLGVGLYGDNSWAQQENYGSANYLFIENNVFNTAGCCENEGSAGGLTKQGGGRVVVRFNQYNSMDNLNFSIGWHGTESSGRPRSTRSFEYYDNTWTCSVHCDSIGGARGGTGLVWGNTFNYSGASLNSSFTLTTYRAHGDPNWGACDGSSVYDTNDGVTYATGTITSVSGSAPLYTLTIKQTGGSPLQPWSTNYWSPTGAPYSVHDVTQSTGGEITSSGSNTVTVNAGTGGPGTWTPNNGDSIQLLRASACIDQAGGRGAGFLYTGTDGSGNATPARSSAQILSPVYAWMNTFNPAFGLAIDNSPTWNGSGRLLRSRDFYVENSNQSAQTNSTSPFDGTNTVGIGHGSLANRPTTCTTGVGYWATDQGNWNHSGSGGQGQLYICSATNTWTPYYAPYSYPHPLTQGSGDPPDPPTDLQAVPQ